MSCSAVKDPKPKKQTESDAYHFCRSDAVGYTFLYQPLQNPPVNPITMKFRNTRCMEQVDEGKIFDCGKASIDKKVYSNKPCSEEKNIILVCELNDLGQRTYFTHIEPEENKTLVETIQKIKDLCNEHGKVIEG